MKRLLPATLLPVALLTVPVLLCAKRGTELVEIRPSIKNPASAFVIFADIETFKECENELRSFRETLESEGLGTFIYASDWRSPEQVRGYIYSVASDVAPLEGMMLMGKIPEVKVKGAAHLADLQLTSSSEEWILTDRFYDCYHLDFNFCGRDSSDQTYSYSLGARGRQEVFCDIYSSRVRIPEEGYAKLRETISSWTLSHTGQNIHADGFMRSGQLNRWKCSINTFLAGDQTALIQFGNDESRKEADDLAALFKMTRDALYSGANCSAELLEIMHVSTSATIRMAALDCLAQFADDNCAEGVKAGLEDGDVTIRNKAARYAAEMGIFPEQAAQSTLQHEQVPAMVAYVLDSSNPIEKRIGMAAELGSYSRSYNRNVIVEGLNVALSRKYSCPKQLREEILKTIRMVR